MTFRVSLKAALVLYASSIVFLFLLALFFPPIGYTCTHIGSMLLVAMALHALIAPFKGLDFVIWDAPPDSPVKHYWFFVIFVAAWVGTALTDILWAYLG
ncbi:MAG: hypothetical protein OXE40_10945 [Gammaproteobacteria bacterium]|nr:hypothetical protein [Gammaproteobacteria bacterium]